MRAGPDTHRRTNRLAGILLALLTTVGLGVTVCSPPANAATYTPPAPRQWLNLNSGWTFLRSDAAGAQSTGFDDSAWSKVNVPHTWNASDGADGGANYYQGTGWYRRHYTPSAGLAGKRLYLQFAGVNQVADVWVNGTHLGQHIGGYARFRFDATAALKPGQDNVVAVRVNNETKPDYGPQRADYTFMGGIYRNVSLWAVDPLQVRMLDYAADGVYVRQRVLSASAATVEVTGKLLNAGSGSRSVAAHVVITDPAGTVVAEQSTSAVSLAAGAGTDIRPSLTITNPHRWDGRTDPYQYSVTVEVRDAAAGTVTDVVTVPLGLRTFSVDPASGFQLNGRSYPLHGVNLHQDYAGAGWAETDAQHTQDWNLIDELGATTVRLAHYQHDQKDYTLADSLGVVLWSEVPNIDFTTDSTAYTANTETALRELIRQNYNHPSVVFWGIGNEQRSNDTKTNNLLTRLAADAKAEDPDRLTTYASAAVADDSAINNHADVSAYNKYFGWYDGTYADLGPWADALHVKNPARKIALSEYGAGANVNQHALNPTAQTSSFHPEEYQSLLHEASWKQLGTRKYLWGTYVWNMFDFASDARSEGGQRGINDKGLVTRDRQTRKDAFYWYKANWSSAPTLYLTSRRWTQRTDATTDVKVYSNASSVQLTVNGTVIGTRAATDHIFTWTGVRLRTGANTVTATATIGGTVHTDTVAWNVN